jgi:hypothetical protein
MTLAFDFEFGLDHAVTGKYKYRELALQVEGVSDQTAIYGYGFCASLISM